MLDAAGNAVANTYTLNTGFGSGVVVAGYQMITAVGCKLGEGEVRERRLGGPGPAYQCTHPLGRATALGGEGSRQGQCLRLAGCAFRTRRSLGAQKLLEALELGRGSIDRGLWPDWFAAADCLEG